MTDEQLNAILRQAEEENNKGNFDNAEQLADKIIVYVDSQFSSHGVNTIDKTHTHRESILIFYSLALLILAETAKRRGNLTAALDFAHRALNFALEYNPDTITARCRNNCGNVCQNLGLYNEALEYYTQALHTYEECGMKVEAAKVIGNIGIIYRDMGDYVRALEYYDKAYKAHQELGDKNSIAIVTGNIGNVYMSLSDYLRALSYYSASLSAYEELGDKNGIAIITGNIGIIYHNLSDYPRALEYMNKALALYEERGDKSGTARIIGNIGNVYFQLLDYPRALESMYMALSTHEELRDTVEVALVMGNIGSVYFSLGNYEKALEYYTQSLATRQQLGNKASIAIATSNIGAVYAQKQYEGYDVVKAEEILLNALAISEDIGARQHAYGVHKSLAELYKSEKRWEEFAVHFEQYHNGEKEVKNEEAKKQAERLDYERKTAEREKQLAVERAEAATVKRILHNTLPPIIADRLINNETFIADSYPNVSVLFMDLVNFTRIAAIIPPRHLIYLLNTIFSNADAVMEKHGLEKIKTIGDAYMAVAGAPIHQDDHAQRAALAAIDVMEAMNNLSVIIPEELGETSWTEQVGEIQVRIGLHCGEAIGGVIGDKKFSFDLWGDAVNTASRMESHGEAGKIHCSEEFKNALAETHGRASQLNNVQFISRGEMEIKGKGKMKTFFLERV